MRIRIVGLVAMSILALSGETANADVSKQELGQFADENGELDGKDTPLQGTIHRIVKTTRNVPAASNELAKAWQLPEPVATQLIEGLILMKYHAWPDSGEHRAERSRALFSAAALAAPGSRKLWRFLFENFGRVGAGCNDPQIRDAFLAQPFASELIGFEPPCWDWLPAIVRRYPDQLELRYALVDYLSDDLPAIALAASNWLVDDLDARGVPLDPLAIQAVRVYWSQLGAAGLGDVLLQDAAHREADLDRILDTPPSAVKKAGAEIIEERRARYYFELARTAYVLALIDAGQLEDARRRVTSHHIDYALATDVLTSKPAGDLFDRYFADREAGVYWKAMNDGALARRIGASFLAAHEYRDAADELGRSDCRDATYDAGPARYEAEVKELPDAYGARRAKFTTLLKALEARMKCMPVDTAGGPAMSSHLPRYPEIPLTAAQLASAPLPSYEAKVPLPASFSPVRTENSGGDIYVVCVSPAVDPGGEVSRGGYWLLRSRDDGKTWKDPLYLGFQDHGPYVVHETGRVPMHAGNLLRLEVDVSELDPGSITFPPVGLRARREAKDVTIDIPIAALEQDTDNDGWPDVLEAKLRTDPLKADSDGDGIDDPLDDFPQASARGVPHRLAGIVTDLLTKLAGYERAGIVEPMRPSGNSGSSLAVVPGTHASAGSRLFTFIEGDPAMFTGLRTGGGQVILVDRAGVNELQAMSGPIFPLKFPLIIVNPAGTRAVVDWSAGWAGGTMLYTLVNGKWKSKQISSWITRRFGPVSRTFPG